ncbi:hypothetical protein [Acetobacterium wieringae]|uniref:hypothetical protein n=1 Tax=Acetobacterium wieringae TaxID=52694 RepID=UPI0026F1FEC5|nr:hypothetical protein [Acetobacterium wieringae]
MKKKINKKAKKVIQVWLGLTLCIATIFMLTACGESTPIEGMVISNKPYNNAAEIEKAEQPADLSVGDTIYGSISLIESPKGMKYQAKWLLDDKEVMVDEKAMETDQRGVLIFPLEADKTTVGMLKLQILYKDAVLAEKEVQIK